MDDSVLGYSITWRGLWSHINNLLREISGFFSLCLIYHIKYSTPIPTPILPLASINSFVRDRELVRMLLFKLLPQIGVCYALCPAQTPSGTESGLVKTFLPLSPSLKCPRPVYRVPMDVFIIPERFLAPYQHLCVGCGSYGIFKYIYGSKINQPSVK